jgi:hypothetical protein
MQSDEMDFVSRQGFSHLFAHGAKKLEERRERIFSNALYVNQRIAPELKYDGRNSDRPILVVDKLDSLNFSVDVQCQTNLEKAVCEAFVKRGVPLMTRSSFGYNLTTIAFTRFNMMRFSFGLEERRFLDQFISAFNDIFRSLGASSKINDEIILKKVRKSENQNFFTTELTEHTEKKLSLESTSSLF